VVDCLTNSHLTDGGLIAVAVMTVPSSLLGAVVSGSWTFGLTPARAVDAVLFMLVTMVLFGCPEPVAGRSWRAGRRARGNGADRQRAGGVAAIYVHDAAPRDSGAPWG
jgi:hypothetical protein